MKKIYLILWTIVITLLVVCTTFVLKQNKKILQENKRLNEIIDLKQEINKEYVYLFKETENKNIKEEINNKKYVIQEKTDQIENLQNTINDLSEENQNIKEEIEAKQKELNALLEEQRRKEIERLEATTVKIDNEITYSQFPNYPTGCESVSLYILLKYNGIETTPDEIINRLKKGDLPYKIEDEMYGGNPELEFVGDPRNDYSYGVFNTPIAEVANTFKGNVQNREGMELDEILNIVSEKRPVMVWTTINNLSSGTSAIWIYRPTGEKIYWKENEHAVVIIGYNDEQVIVSDPYTGRITRYNRNIFRENYNYMGKRAVYY